MFHSCFQEWVELGICEQVWELSLADCEDVSGKLWKQPPSTRFRSKVTVSTWVVEDKGYETVA
jgi:hypothetical protein